MSGIQNLLLGGSPAAAAAEDPNFEYVTLLLPGNGTNGAQNNTFIDSSTNNFTITRNGNTTQGTFSPFSQTGWSNYFDGSGDYLSVADNTAFDLGSGAFTLEAWIFSPDVTPSKAEWIISQWQSDTGNSWGFRIETDGSLNFYYSSDGNNAALVGTSTPGLSANVWHHIAVVRNSNTVTIYVDGVSKASGTVSATFYNSSASVMVGNQAATGLGQTFTGYISNARVVKGTAVYTAAFTPPTSPLTAITNTSLLTCQSNRFIDNSTNAFAITVNGNTSVQAFSPFAPTAAYSAATNGGSGYFDGSGDYLSIAGASQLRPGTGDFTLEGWFYLTNFTGDKYLINQNFNNADGSFGNFLIYVTGTTGVMKYWSSTNGSSWNNISGISLGTAKLNEWFHVAVSRLSGTTKTFLNGVEQASQADSGNLNNTGGIYVGTYAPGQANVNGYASGVRLLVGTGYSSISIPTAPPTAITNTSLLLNFTNAGIIDSTGKNNLETVGNAQISNTTAKWGSTSIKFDGNGDSLLLPSNPDLVMGSGDFTIEMWAYYAGASYSGIQYLVDQRNTEPQIAISLYFNGQAVEFYVNGSSRISANTTAAVQTWQHIALVRYGGTTKLYVDGSQIGSSYADSNTYVAPKTTIGDRYSGSYVLNGYIQDLRITKGVARYTANFTAPTAAFPLF